MAVSSLWEVVTTPKVLSKLGQADPQLAGPPHPSAVVQRDMLGPSEPGMRGREHRASCCLVGAAARGEVPCAPAGQLQAGHLPASRGCVGKLVDNHTGGQQGGVTLLEPSPRSSTRKKHNRDDIPGGLREASMQLVMPVSAVYECAAGEPQWPSRSQCTSQLQTEPRKLWQPRRAACRQPTQPPAVPQLAAQPAEPGQCCCPGRAASALPLSAVTQSELRPGWGQPARLCTRAADQPAPHAATGPVHIQLALPHRQGDRKLQVTQGEGLHVLLGCHVLCATAVRSAVDRAGGSLTWRSASQNPW